MRRGGLKGACHPPPGVVCPPWPAPHLHNSKKGNLVCPVCPPFTQVVGGRSSFRPHRDAAASKCFRLFVNNGKSCRKAAAATHASEVAIGCPASSQAATTRAQAHARSRS